MYRSTSQRTPRICQVSTQAHEAILVRLSYHKGEIGSARDDFHTPSSGLNRIHDPTTPVISASIPAIRTLLDPEENFRVGKLYSIRESLQDQISTSRRNFLTSCQVIAKGIYLHQSVHVGCARQSSFISRQFPPSRTKWSRQSLRWRGLFP